MEHKNENIYSGEQLERFAKAVQMLSYDHGDTCEDYVAEHHGSGVFVLFNGYLFFLCTKHSFHLDGKVAKPQIEYYDSLCFFKDSGILQKPKYTRIVPFVKNKYATHIPEEDVLIYLIDPSWEDYQVYKESAAIINSREAYNALVRHHFYAFFCGYPTQYDGNVDYESHTVHQEKKGRYALVEMPQKEPNFISAKIDVSGFVKEPSQREEFSMNGMSGGGLFTCTNNNSSLFLGMCLAGTVESKRAHFLSVCYIEFMLSEYLKGENVVVSSTVPNT